MSSRPPPHDPSPEARAAMPDAGLLARRLMARELAPNADDADDAAILAAIERIGARLVDGLASWFGPYGASALVTRALARVRPSHPALADVAVGHAETDGRSGLTGLAGSARTHGVRLLSDGIVATLESLASLISRLIGDELAVGLLEQSTIARPVAGDPTPLPRDPAGSSPADNPQQTVKSP